MTTPRRRGAVNASLFAQVLALMAGALIFAVVANVVIIRLGPPPIPETHTVEEIADAYLGAPPPEGKAALRVSFVNERPARSAPTSVEYRRAIRNQLARLIKTQGGPELDPGEIRVFSAAPQWVNDRWIQQNPNILGDRRTELFLIAPFKVGFPEADGRWKVVASQPGLRLDPGQQRTLLTALMTSIIILVAAALFTRRLTHPFKQLAEGAERLGRDPGAASIPVQGPSEARVAAQAFNQMQERLKRYVEDRTEMIGAIAHDLRTPLTRLRFRIESAPDDQKAKMTSDLDQMEAMISATMAFVRDATHKTERTKLELSSVLESLADEMSETGSDVTMLQSERVVIEGDPIALKRLFSNLLDNAVKYGKRARVRVFPVEGHAIVEIDDDGPGLPEADRERVFEPFYRQERSRNRDTGGIGLGLAVVRSVARGHGGDAELLNREGGGMTARVKLPV